MISMYLPVFVLWNVTVLENMIDYLYSTSEIAVLRHKRGCIQPFRL